MSGQFYTIKDLASRTGLTTDAIRFYEKKNLIQPKYRGHNKYRYYDDYALKRITFIKRCRALDLSLKEIESLIELEQSPQQNCTTVNHLIDTHLEQIENQLIELQNLQIQLQQLRLSCSEQTTVNNCQILKSLEATN